MDLVFRELAGQLAGLSPRAQQSLNLRGGGSGSHRPAAMGLVASVRRGAETAQPSGSRLGPRVPADTVTTSSVEWSRIWWRRPTPRAAVVIECGDAEDVAGCHSAPVRASLAVRASPDHMLARCPPCR